MLSKTAEHAIRAITAIAAHADQGPVLAREIAELTDIPTNYLSKILHNLTRAGFLVSERGRGGGFSLARPAKEILAHDIVDLFDDLQGRRRCFMGHPTCNKKVACPAHDKWSKVWDTYEKFLKSTSISQLAEDNSRLKKSGRKKRTTKKRS